MGAITDAAWPVTGPSSVTKTIPAYPYTQYQDDDNVRAFFDALNIYSQAYVDWFNTIDLPIYTKAPVSGTLLDWVAAGLYGITRPGLPISSGSPDVGPVNTYTTNEIALNSFREGTPDTYVAVDDDFFRRILTWKLYRGDGDVPTVAWLKRRINRFLYGINGGEAPSQTTYDISIVPTGVRKWTITVPSTQAGTIFKNAVGANVISLPFQIVWTVVTAP